MTVENSKGLLAKWVANKHDGQLIRETQEPYFNHVAAVAALAAPAVRLGYEIGLCHDLLEDTDTTETQLFDVLIKFGYADADAGLIASCVTELTDTYTADRYPDLSKKIRKEKEAARLQTISATAQTVKYGDLIYNIGWVMQYDQQHAKKYLLKKLHLLVGMNKGEHNLLQQALLLINQSLTAL